MIPLELKVDKEGLLYTDDKSLLKDNLFLDKRRIDLDQKYFTHGFFRFDSTIEYIIKYCYTVLTNQQSDEYKEMLRQFVAKQPKVQKTDLPIGYFREGKRANGLIIKYYPDGISLDNVLKEHDINLIGKYYFHDEDTIHNLFMLLEEIIENISEMFENDIYYTDINSGNIIIDNNKIKVIDFEPNNVKFDKKDLRLKNILQYIYALVLKVLREYELDSSFNENILCFEEAKRMVKKLEDKARVQNGIRRTF